MGNHIIERDVIPNFMLWVFAIVAILIICWDTYFTVRDQPQHTVSEIFYQWSINMPALPFAIGFLCGHLFWRR